jgi:hypothetical protein
MMGGGRGETLACDDTACRFTSSNDLHGVLSRDGSDVSVGVTQVSLLSVGRKEKKRVMILP